MTRPTPNETAKPGRRALADWTVSRLYEMIFSGELQAGSPLGEVEITELLGVSRSPIRDALRQLEESGLVEVVPTSGRRVVRRFDVSDVYELYTIRVELESLSVRHAAERITASQIRHLEALLTAMNKAKTMAHKPAGRDFEADFRFHEAVCRASGLDRLHRILSGLWLQTRALLRHLDAAGIYPTANELDQVVDDHAQVLNALRAHDAAAAERAISDHLRVRRDHLVEAVRARGGIGFSP
ncbi:MAG: GntR family transcriptional regulator [Candidatus Limnocylindria bacterium]